MTRLFSDNELEPHYLARTQLDLGVRMSQDSQARLTGGSLCSRVIQHQKLRLNRPWDHVNGGSLSGRQKPTPWGELPDFREILLGSQVLHKNKILLQLVKFCWVWFQHLQIKHLSTRLENIWSNVFILVLCLLFNPVLDCLSTSLLSKPLLEPLFVWAWALDVAAFSAHERAVIYKFHKTQIEKDAASAQCVFLLPFTKEKTFFSKPQRGQSLMMVVIILTFTFKFLSG